MNVQHAGHAKTVEEAELLMSWLMKGGVERTGGGSPQSLKHSSSTSCLPSGMFMGQTRAVSVASHFAELLVLRSDDVV